MWSLMADLARRKVGPLKKEREAEVNGGGVQRIGGGLEFKAECSIGVEPAGLLDEDLGEIGKDAPGPFFVGHRQGVTGGGVAGCRPDRVSGQRPPDRFRCRANFRTKSVGRRRCDHRSSGEKPQQCGKPPSRNSRRIEIEKTKTVRKYRFYRAEIGVRKFLTGQ